MAAAVNRESTPPLKKMAGFGLRRTSLEAARISRSDARLFQSLIERLFLG
jgi:hypothetical protein